MTRDLSEADRALLTSEPLVANLATCADGRPHVAPVWFDYRDGAIELTTTGRKLENLRRNPKVALSVHDVDPVDPQWGMTLLGTATPLDEAATTAVRCRVNRRYGAPEDAWPENAGVRVDVGTVQRYWG